MKCSSAISSAIPIRRIIVMLFIVQLLTAVSHATIDWDDGLSHTLDASNHLTELLNLDYNIANNPGTHVDFIDGGYTSEDIFLYNNATLDMSGGVLDNFLYAYDNASINFSGGINNYRIYANNNSHITISGGSVGQETVAFDNSHIEVTGGVLPDLYPVDDATITVTGGSLGILRVYANALMSIYGGSNISELSANGYGIIELYGTEFFVNGVPLQDGDKLTSYTTYGSPSARYFVGQITGTLADGSNLDNEFLIAGTGGNTDRANIYVHIVPEPTTLSLAVVLLLGIVLRRRRRG